jgi:hypothetical protein
LVADVHKFLVGNSGEKDNLGDLGVDERIILNWVLQKWGRHLYDAEQGPV